MSQEEQLLTQVKWLLGQHYWRDVRELLERTLTERALPAAVLAAVPVEIHVEVVNWLHCQGLTDRTGGLLDHVRERQQANDMPFLMLIERLTPSALRYYVREVGFSDDYVRSLIMMILECYQETRARLMALEALLPRTGPLHLSDHNRFYLQYHARYRSRALLMAYGQIPLEPIGFAPGAPEETPLWILLRYPQVPTLLEEERRQVRAVLRVVLGKNLAHYVEAAI